MPSTDRRALIVATIERRAKVEALLLRGETNKRKMAAMFGVGRGTIHRDEKWIRQQWKRQLHSDREALVAERVSMLKQLLFANWDSYLRSKQDAEIVTTSSRVVRCRCGGKPDCTACGGTGRTQVTTETRRIEGKAGNPTFLKNAITCVMEMCEIQGLRVEKAEIEVTFKELVRAGEHVPAEQLDALIEDAWVLRRAALEYAQQN